MTAVIVICMFQSVPHAAAQGAAAPAPLPLLRVDKTGPETSVRHFDGQNLEAWLRGKKSTDALAEVLISDGKNHRVSNTFRDRNGLVEFHESWRDHIFVQQGEAKFLTGGKMVDVVDTAPGEKRASSIVGGTVTVLHAGDYFFIPPGTPHQMLVDKDKNVRFVVFKTRE
jgi:hypothetical protein